MNSVSYLVVGRRESGAWAVEVPDVGRTTAPDLAGIEAAARGLLAGHGVADAATVDLQLLVPDFEVDLQQQGIPRHGLRPVEIVSGVIALVVVIGALAFLLGRLLG